jgi:hypothetical protein
MKASLHRNTWLSPGKSPYRTSAPSPIRPIGAWGPTFSLCQTPQSIEAVGGSIW